MGARGRGDAAGPDAPQRVGIGGGGGGAAREGRRGARGDAAARRRRRQGRRPEPLAAGAVRRLARDARDAVPRLRSWNDGADALSNIRCDTLTEC